MNTKRFIVGFCALALLAGAAVSPQLVRAQSPDITAMLEQIRQLTTMVTQLQEQLAAMRGEVRELREELKANLREGVQDDDVRKIQALLASDPTIYPEGLQTGYFGPMTREALKRFQRQFSLAETGAVDEETRAALEALLEERRNGQTPPGLLRAPGIQERVKDRVLERVCKNPNRGAANAVRCADFDRDQDDDDVLEIEVEVEKGIAEVDIDFGDDSDKDDVEFEMEFTTEADVIAEIAERTDLTKSQIEAVIEFEYEEDDVDVLEIEVEIKNGVAEVDIDFGDDSDKEDVKFEMDFTTEADVITEIVSRTDLTESEIEAVIEFEYEEEDDEDDEEDDEDES